MIRAGVFVKKEQEKKLKREEMLLKIETYQTYLKSLKLNIFLEVEDPDDENKYWMVYAEGQPVPITRMYVR